MEASEYREVDETSCEFKLNDKQSNFYEKEFNDTLATANIIKLNKKYNKVMSSKCMKRIKVANN